MVEPENIIELISSSIKIGPLAGKVITITAGPTREQIDPVRFISNNSSGKMGYALAEAAIEAGALVNLISGPVSIEANKSANVYKINSASEMLDKVDELMPNTDIFIGCAAVSDFKPSHYNENKIKKDDLNVIDLELKKNKDILSHVAKVYKSSYVVGFAAETKNAKENARKKLLNKKLDMIISNDVSDKSIGFDSAQNPYQGKSHLALRGLL